MDLENERNFMETAKRSVVKWAGNQIQHDLVADSKIVAPSHLFTFRFESRHCATQTVRTRFGVAPDQTRSISGASEKPVRPATQLTPIEKDVGNIDSGNRLEGRINPISACANRMKNAANQPELGSRVRLPCNFTAVSSRSPH